MKGREWRGRFFSPEEIQRIVRDPAMRWQEVPDGQVLVEQFLLNPQDRHLQEVFTFYVEQQLAKKLSANDPFYGNGDAAPVAGGKGCLELHLPSGQPYPVSIVTGGSENQNIVITGPAGGGKTSLLRLVIITILNAGGNVVLVERKCWSETVGRDAFVNAGHNVVVLQAEDLQLCPMQPPMGMSSYKFVGMLVPLLATQLSLIASTRVVLDCAYSLFQEPRPRGSWPTWSEWTMALKGRMNKKFSREAQYAEVAYLAFRQVRADFGASLDCTRSSMLEELVSHPGLVVISTENQSDGSASLLAALLMHYSYHWRRLQVMKGSQPRPVFFAMDDALRLGMETKGWEGVHPNSVGEFARLGRAFGQFVTLVSQNYGQLSSVLRGNTGAWFAAGPSTGEDAEALARDLSLSREQQALIPMLKPGMVVVRRVGFPAVQAWFEEVK